MGIFTRKKESDCINPRKVLSESLRELDEFLPQDCNMMADLMYRYIQDKGFKIVKSK